MLGSCSNLRKMGSLPCFSNISTKGSNFCEFLFASTGNTTLLKWGLLLKERICSYKKILKNFQLGANSFLGKFCLEQILSNKSRVASPDSVPIHLNETDIVHLNHSSAMQ